MSIEVKVLEVLPEEEQGILDVMYLFGWQLKNSQNIYNKTAIPVGAITYKGFSYIHSETEIENYNKLIFERNTSIPDYTELVALEEEFWELIEYDREARPLSPPPLMDFKTWFRDTRPQIISIWKVLLVALFSYLAFCGINEIRQDLFDHMLTRTDLNNALFGGGACAIAYALFYPIWVRLIPFSVGHRKLHAQYDRYKAQHAENIAVVELYDLAQVRIPEIVAEVRTILNQN